MLYDIQYKINSDINLKKFLRENSYWYKELNRNPENFKYFVEDMKIKYKLKDSVYSSKNELFCCPLKKYLKSIN